MIDRKSTKYRLLLVTLSLVLLGGAGFVAMKLVGKKMLVQHLQISEAAYARGLAAYDAKDFAKAQTEFDEAIREAAAGIQELEKRPKAHTAEMSTEEFRAKLVWVYVQAVRDRGYTKGELDGKPLTTLFDSTAKQSYRSILSLPDNTTRNNLGQLLRRVVALLPKELAVQQELLRVELVLARIDWDIVKQLCENIIVLAPNDARARFILAHYEFEQPGKDGVPTPDGKRDFERVRVAQQHLAKALEAHDYPPWRTLGLEVRALNWIVQYPAKQNKNLDVTKEKTRLKAILTDEKRGLPALLTRKDAYDALTKYDSRGMIDLFTLAADNASAEPNGPLAPTLLSFTTTINAIPDHLLDGTSFGDLFDSACVTFVKHADTAKLRESVTWGLALDGLDQAGKKLILRKQLSPKRCVTLSELFAREGKGRFANAIAWATEGLKLEPTDDMKADLHLMCMNLKSNEGRPVSEIRPHAEALRDSTSRKGQAIAGYFEATTSLDAGKFDNARKWLEEVVRRPEGGDLVVRSYVILPDLYMALGKPIEAAAYAKELDRGYDRITTAPRSLQTWASDYFRTHQDVIAAVVITQYDAAKLKVERERREHPERTIMPEFTRLYEETAQRALDRLLGKSPANMLARVARCDFLSHVRPDAMRKELDSLRNDYPASPAVLRLEFAHADAASKQRLEERVQKLAEDPDYAALWAEWLIITDRSAEAVKYLETQAMPEAKALATLLKNVKKDNPTTTALFTRALVKDPAAPHHERLATQQLKTALALLGANKPLEAGLTFRRLQEHALFRTASREGMSQCLATLAKTDPEMAKKYTAEWLP